MNYVRRKTTTWQNTTLETEIMDITDFQHMSATIQPQK